MSKLLPIRRDFESWTGSSFVACYAAGTRILTAAGEVPVERLRAGDLVATLNDFGLAPIRWVGHRRIDLARHPGRPAATPIRIRAHAFASGRPHRDLLLSPDHAVFVDGALIPVRALLNGLTIVREEVESVTYYHLELDRHDVLLAEGLPAESDRDGGGRAAFAAAGAEVRAAPDRSAAVWLARSCAPIVLDGAVLAAVRATLLSRARAAGSLEPEAEDADAAPDARLAAPMAALAAAAPTQARRPARRMLSA
jgi:hypothetical protein